MGTNYYHVKNRCRECGRTDAPVHIGKLSAGWIFTFHSPEEEEGAERIRSFAAWRERLQEGEIEDEYHEAVPLDEFTALVEKTKGRRNHAEEYGTDAARKCWTDAQGFPFSAYEFS